VWESDITKINNRVGIKLDVVVVSPPVSSNAFVTSTSAAMFARVRRCVVISVKGSSCCDRYEWCVVSGSGIAARDDPVMWMQSLKRSAYLPLRVLFLQRLECKVLQSSVSAEAFTGIFNVSKSGIRTGRFQLFERVTKFDLSFLVVFLICSFQ